MPVGDPGNPGHPVLLEGSIAYAFDISKHEVTNEQYAVFLNAVAESDPNGLFDSRMMSDAALGGIERAGISGAFVYSVKAGFSDRAVSYLSFWSAARFANWLHNGMPIGSQDATTTEDGAYTLTPTSVADNSVARNPGARFAIPTRPEWWKAGYYDPDTQTWFRSPAQSQTGMTCAAPSLDDGNTGSCSRSPFVIEPVGSYAASVGPNGTFDQGGNVREWVDRVTLLDRETHGGSFASGTGDTDISAGNHRRGATIQESNTGFRLVRLGPAVPVPGLGALGAGVALLGSIASSGLARRSLR